MSRPIRIIHGKLNADVPWQQSEKLVAYLANEDVKLKLIEDGKHRFSCEQDIEHLLMTTAELV